VIVTLHVHNNYTPKAHGVGSIGRVYLTTQHNYIVMIYIYIYIYIYVAYFFSKESKDRCMDPLYGPELGLDAKMRA